MTYESTEYNNEEAHNMDRYSNRTNEMEIQSNGENHKIFLKFGRKSNSRSKNMKRVSS